MVDKNKKESWRERLRQSRKPFNPDMEIKKETQPSDTDTVIKHPENGSNIRITDSGAIKIFADKNLGITIDPESQSITAFGEKANLRLSELNLHTDRDGFKWNYTTLNRALADPSKEILTALSPAGTEIFKKILSNPGTYTTPAGPTTPGSISALSSAKLEGVSAFKGIKKHRPDPGACNRFQNKLLP